MNYKQKYHQFYNSREWKELSKIKKAKEDYLCEECRKKGKIVAGKEVHHIVPIAKNWDLRLDYKNLQLLCSECHRKKTR